MLIQASKPLPSCQELMEILQRDFSTQYSYGLFGLGDAKGIMVTKSPFIGAHVCMYDREIRVQGSLPSLTTAFILSVFGWTTELGFALLNIFGFQLLSPMKKFEKDVAQFLHRRYSDQREYRSQK